MFARGLVVSVNMFSGEEKVMLRDLEWLWRIQMTSNWKSFLLVPVKCLNLIMVSMDLFYPLYISNILYHYYESVSVSL